MTDLLYVTESSLEPWEVGTETIPVLPIGKLSYLLDKCLRASHGSSWDLRAGPCDTAAGTLPTSPSKNKEWAGPGQPFQAPPSAISLQPALPTPALPHLLSRASGSLSEGPWPTLSLPPKIRV